MAYLFDFLFTDVVMLWMILGCVAIAVLITIEKRQLGICNMLLIVTLTFFQLFTPFKPFTYAVQHPQAITADILGYITIGVLYMYIKWRRHVSLIGRKFDQIKASLRKTMEKESTSSNSNNGGYFIGDVSGPLTETGRARLYRLAALELGVNRLPLQVSEHKSLLYLWWLCWPLDMLWTLINDPIRALWRLIYDTIKGHFQAVADRSIHL